MTTAYRVWCEARKGRKFFFEKKKQKTFACLTRAHPGKPEPGSQKFFASFFQKRRLFLPFAATPAGIICAATRGGVGWPEQHDEGGRGTA
jgi:hypothetical protein